MKRRTLIVLIAVTVAIGAGVAYGLIRKPTVAKPSQTRPSTTQQTNKEPSAAQAETFNKSQYSLDDPTSVWVVVNKQRPLNPKSYAPSDLTAIGSGQYMRAAAAQAFLQMIADAKAAGYSLNAESGYRSYDTQVSVYANEVKNYGQTTADTESARPGYSEHQTGWAVDIASPGCEEDCFGATAAAKWVLTNSSKYGFIQRYPENKSAITGYRDEPWHFRYVGVDLAQQVEKSGQTLEEFFGLPPATTY